VPARLSMYRAAVMEEIETSIRGGHTCRLSHSVNQ
jgi:hypothetical protein